MKFLKFLYKLFFRSKYEQKLSKVSQKFSFNQFHQAKNIIESIYDSKLDDHTRTQIMNEIFELLSEYNQAHIFETATPEKIIAALKWIKQETS